MGWGRINRKEENTFYGLLMAAAMVLVVLGLAWWSRPRPWSGGVHHWVCAREGLVRFGPDAVIVHPWASVREVVVLPGAQEGVGLKLDPQGSLDFFAMQPGQSLVAYREAMIGQRQGFGVDVCIPVADLGDSTPRAFAQRVARALGSDDARRELPTFYQPDGPAAAVLADLK